VLAADASRGRIAILADAGNGSPGKVVWDAKLDNIHDLQYLDNGNLLFQTSWTKLVEMTPDKKVTWSYDSAQQNGNAGKQVQVHAFQRLAGGVTMIAESGPARIIEVDRAGRLLKVIPLTIDNPDPHRDTRLVRKLQNGHYLVAHEGDGAVREYDADGRVVWDYDVPLFDRPRKGGHGPGAWGNQTFAAIRLPNGNTLISTGNGHSVLEVSRKKQIVWRLKQDDLPGIRLAWVTTLEVLPGGNYLIGNCHAGPGQPQIIEITPDKRVVWKFENFAVLGNAVSNGTLIDAKGDERFYRDKVQPILANNCYKCHGNRDGKIRGELWLRSRTNVVRGGHDGPIIDFVAPEQSRLLRFINHEDAEHRMPPKQKLPAEQIAVLTEWVARGAPMSVAESEWVYEKPTLLTAEAKAHWAFQPIADPKPPEVEGEGWCKNDIDRFVLARLQQAGLSPNGPADKVSFIRRVTYSVTGLPPTVEEIEAFVADRSADAHERLVDRLLASPHYGEHWARHWLDLVRWGETNGYERDGDKPEAWRYRQYVIDAFNSNKPYDRFVTEQIAGDELDDPTADSITATGFLRLGLWDDEPADPQQAVFDGLDDIVRTTSEVFLGLTMGCARCHDHKLDPIPQRDYYAMLAFFRNIQPYSKNRADILTDVSTAEQKREVARKNAVIHEQRAELSARLDEIRSAFAAAYRKDQGKEIEGRRLEQLLRDHGRRLLGQAEFEEQQALRRRIRRLRDVPSPHMVLSIKERGPKPPDTHVLIRGSAHAPGARVEPGFPQILTRTEPRVTPRKSSSGRRRALAEWIVGPDNQLAARVMVNRVWQFHFGRGIVRSSSDFGMQGRKPTHPKLLDWLATRFVQDGWDLKKLHKRILLSATYRQSSATNKEALAKDPVNVLFWRVDVRRLTAEELRDSILVLSGRLDGGKIGGPSVYPAFPIEVLKSQSRITWRGNDSIANNSRRSVYTFVKRSLLDPLIESFDAATTDTSCAVRFQTTQPTQALTLLNSEFIHKAARDMTERLVRSVGTDPVKFVTEALTLATGRTPDREHVRTGVAFLESFPDPVDARQALQQYCLIVLNLNEFAFVD